MFRKTYHSKNQKCDPADEKKLWNFRGTRNKPPFFPVQIMNKLKVYTLKCKTLKECC